jgi:hypothetical protein
MGGAMVATAAAAGLPDAEVASAEMMLNGAVRSRAGSDFVVPPLG